MRPWDSKIAGKSLPSADSVSLRERPHCLSVSLSPCLTMTPFFMGWGFDLHASMEQCTATPIKVAGLPPSASILTSALLVGLRCGVSSISSGSSRGSSTALCSLFALRVASLAMFLTSSPRPLCLSLMGMRAQSWACQAPVSMGLPAHLTVGMFDVGARVPQGNLRQAGSGLET